MRLTDAVQGGRRAALEALRDRLAVEVERVAEEGFCQVCRRGSSSIAPLAKQLRDVVAELDGLSGSEEVSLVDDLAAKRVARRSAAQGS